MISKAEHDAAIAERDGQINALRYRLEQLERLIFAAKSERFAPSSTPEQMALWDQDGDAGTEEVEKQKITYERKKKKAHPGRTPLPDHLPVRQLVLNPEEDTTGMVKIGEEITRKVDYMHISLPLTPLFHSIDPPPPKPVFHPQCGKRFTGLTPSG